MQSFFQPGISSAEQIGSVVDAITTDCLMATARVVDLRARASEIRTSAAVSPAERQVQALTIACLGPFALMSPSTWRVAANLVRTQRAHHLETLANRMLPSED